jgi:hypothetical protein
LTLSEARTPAPEGETLFVSETCEGEACWCGKPAVRKVGEEFADDEPNPNRHNLTRYICAHHFAELMGPAGARSVGIAPVVPVGVSVDALAQEIRRVDGRHTLGAGALAEALLPFLAALRPTDTGEAMTTPDIAGLCEKLRKPLDYALRLYECDVGTTMANAADTIERQAAEIKRLREALSGINQLARDRLALIPADLVCGGVVGDLLVDILGRAALTGEDAAGSPTSQNTKPGLPFSDAGEP